MNADVMFFKTLKLAFWYIKCLELYLTIILYLIVKMQIKDKSNDQRHIDCLLSCHVLILEWI